MKRQNVLNIQKKVGLYSYEEYEYGYGWESESGFCDLSEESKDGLVGERKQYPSGKTFLKGMGAFALFPLGVMCDGIYCATH